MKRGKLVGWLVTFLLSGLSAFLVGGLSKGHSGWWGLLLLVTTPCSVLIGLFVALLTVGWLDTRRIR